jgi:hypothetical protein
LALAASGWLKKQNCSPPAGPGLEAGIEQFAESKWAVVEGETTCGAVVAVEIALAKPTRIQLATRDVSRVRNKPAGQLAPRNPFTLRALGQLLLMKDHVPAALPHLRAAATVAPDDPINLFTYAQCLLAIEGESHKTEAGELFKRALRLAPVGELAEKIKNQQRRLADRGMRSNAQGLPRMDAVMYLSSALESYRALDLVGQKQLLGEVAAVGQKGLAINNPYQKHHLRQFQGGVTVSALQLAFILYVGVQLLLPGQDAGIDIAREYKLAKGMAGADSAG